MNANYGGETTTDADGTFIVELPTEGLRGTRYASGGYELAVAVTSQSGETQEAPSVWFSLGQAYSITPSAAFSGRRIRRSERFRGKSHGYCGKSGETHSLLQNKRI